MNLILPLNALSESDKLLAGGKAVSMARLNEKGFPVPESLCVTTAVYDRFVEATGLRERILLELNRKSFKEMRWEEIWDASLRIRNLFLLQSFSGRS